MLLAAGHWGWLVHVFTSIPFIVQNLVCLHGSLSSILFVVKQVARVFARKVADQSISPPSHQTSNMPRDPLGLYCSELPPVFFIHSLCIDKVSCLLLGVLLFVCGYIIPFEGGRSQASILFTSLFCIWASDLCFFWWQRQAVREKWRRN